MINLQDTCCLDINFDDHEQTVHYGEDVYPQQTVKIPLKHLIPTLLNKALIYPEIVYEEHKQVFRETDRNMINNGFSFDLVIIPPGLLGIEFIKTHIYYTPVEENKYSTIVEVHVGSLTVIMQKNKPKGPLDFDTYVEEGLVVKLMRGEKIAIPTGYYYTFINTEDQPTIFVRIYKKNGTLDYSFLKRENGLAYYCIRKNARQEIVHNPYYREIPKIKHLQANAFLDRIGLEPELSLYTQLMTRTQYFLNSLWE